MHRQPAATTETHALSPPKSLTPSQQLEAVRLAQARVEQRVKLGVQLFRAAEAQLTEQQDLLADARAEQSQLRQQLEADVTRSLRAYDQWMGQMDDRMSRAIDKLEQRLEALDDQWQQTENRLTEMVQRSESLLQQSQSMLNNVPRKRGPSVQT